jgi:hypothetical protein
MALGNLPGIPQQYYPRIGALIRKLEDRELTPKEVGDHILRSLGKIRIDSEGISVSGDFGRLGFGPPELRAIIDSVLNLIDTFPILRDKELLIKQGNKIGKIKLGLLMRMVPSNLWESNNEKIPMVEIVSDVKSIVSLLSYLIGEMDGVIDLAEKGVRVYRLEELLGWSADWQEFSKLLNVAIPALALTTKEVADRVSDSATALYDDILKRCGV